MDQTTVVTIVVVLLFVAAIIYCVVTSRSSPGPVFDGGEENVARLRGARDQKKVPIYDTRQLVDMLFKYFSVWRVEKEFKLELRVADHEALHNAIAILRLDYGLNLDHKSEVSGADVVTYTFSLNTSQQRPIDAREAHHHTLEVTKKIENACAKKVLNLLPYVWQKVAQASDAGMMHVYIALPLPAEYPNTALRQVRSVVEERGYTMERNVDGPYINKVDGTAYVSFTLSWSSPKSGQEELDLEGEWE